jgi:hypothetical protein
MDLLVTFKENPTYFLLALVCGGLGIALAMGALLTRKRARASLGLAVAAVALGALAMTCGAIDAAQRRHIGDVVAMMPELSAADHARILADANTRAGHALHFGLAVGTVPFLGGLALSLAALSRRRPHFTSAGASM